MSDSTYITFSIRIYRGWLVTFAAAATGLVLGILYVWSVVKSGIPDSWGWSNAEKALPYSMMCAAFSVTMIPAGRLQDRFGPRMVIMLGGLLAGLGCVVCGLGGDAVWAYVIGFGVLTGSGVGFGYAATTPASIKWFQPQRTGLIAGIVVAGFGLAPVILAPLTAWMLNFFQVTTPDGAVQKGVSGTMIGLGVIIWIVVGLLSSLVKNPPEGIGPPSRDQGFSKAHRPSGVEFDWQSMLATKQFWLMFFMYFMGAAAGLMFISVAQDLGRKTLGQWAFFAVVVLSAGNTLGRILAGVISDKIGRQWTLLAEFVCQTLTVAALFAIERSGGSSWLMILVVAFLLGMNYGSNLALFPAACKDYFGIRNFGLNYGCLFAAFGSAGLIMPWVNGRIRDLTGSSDLSYLIVIGMMIFSAVLALISRWVGHPAQPRVATETSKAVAVSSGR